MMMRSWSFSMVELGNAIAVGLLAWKLISAKEDRVDRMISSIIRRSTFRANAAGFAYDEHTVSILMVSLLGVSLIAGAVISVLIAMCAPIVAGTAVWIFLGVRIRTNERRNEKVNDEICYFVGRILRAGHSLDHALQSASERFPGSQLLRGITHQCGAGATLKQSIDVIEAERQISSTERMLCATIVLAHAMGGNSARIFERIGDSFHQTYELIEDTTAALAQVRMSMYVIVSLPVVMVLFSMVLGSNATVFLLTQPIGWICLLTGLGLEALGFMWMKKLVDNGVGVWTS